MPCSAWTILGRRRRLERPSEGGQSHSRRRRVSEVTFDVESTNGKFVRATLRVPSETESASVTRGGRAAGDSSCVKQVHASLATQPASTSLGAASCACAATLEPSRVVVRACACGCPSRGAVHCGVGGGAALCLGPCASALTASARTSTAWLRGPRSWKRQSRKLGSCSSTGAALDIGLGSITDGRGSALSPSLKNRLAISSCEASVAVDALHLCTASSKALLASEAAATCTNSQTHARALASLVPTAGPGEASSSPSNNRTGAMAARGYLPLEDFCFDIRGAGENLNQRGRMSAKHKRGLIRSVVENAVYIAGSNGSFCPSIARTPRQAHPKQANHFEAFSMPHLGFQSCSTQSS
eukprot:2452289-Pleurochrysis_carterae.AAC.4